METFYDVISTDKLVFVQFYSNTSEECKLMNPTLGVIKSRLGKNIRIIKVDVDKHPDIAHSYNIESVPTQMLFRSNQLLWRHYGNMPLEDFLLGIYCHMNWREKVSSSWTLSFIFNDYKKYIISAVGLILFLLVTLIICVSRCNNNSKVTTKENDDAIADTTKSTVDKVKGEVSSDTLSIEKQKELEEWERNAEYASTSLQNGSTPYSQWYGRNHYYSKEEHCCDITVTASNHLDAIVIVKRKNQFGKVLGHLYIRSGCEGTIQIPNGKCQIFFYEGIGWNPEKDMGKVIGGFVNQESVSKTETLSLNDKIEHFTLIYDPNGNFVPKKSNKEELF